MASVDHVTPEKVPLFLERLLNELRLTRSTAAVDLSRILGEESYNSLSREIAAFVGGGLRKPNREQCYAAVLALVLLGEPDAIEQLDDIPWPVKKPIVRSWVVQAMNRIPANRLAPCLNVLISSVDPYISREAHNWALKCGIAISATAHFATNVLVETGPNDHDALVGLLAHPDPHVRVNAAHALSKSADPRVIRALRLSLWDTNREVRLIAADFAAGLDDEAGIPMLLRALRDSKYLVRETAARALSKTKSRQALKPLFTCLSDGSTSVRVAAAESLGSMGDGSAVIPLIMALKDPYPMVSLEVRRALLRLNGDNVVQHLLAGLHQSDPFVRWSAVQLLGQLGHGGATNVLCSLLEDPDPMTRSLAIWSLRASKDREAVPTLANALRDRIRTVRSSAAFALGKVGDRQVATVLLDSLSDRVKSVRWAAALSLVRVGHLKFSAISDDADLGIPPWIIDVYRRPSKKKGLSPSFDDLTNEHDFVRYLANCSLAKARRPTREYHISYYEYHRNYRLRTEINWWVQGAIWRSFARKRISLNVED